MGSTTARLESAISGFNDGDISAARELISVAQKRLRQQAHRLLRQYPQVRLRGYSTSDIAQEAARRFYRAALRKVQAGQAPTPLNSAEHFLRRVAWLGRIILISLAKEASKRPINVEIGTLEEYGITASPGAAEQLRDLLSVLPPKERTVFSMRHYGGFDNSAIAAALGCSERTVTRHWNHARELLRKEIQKYSED